MKYLLSVLIFLIPFTSFAEDWVLLNNDFECTNDKNKSCYFNLYDNDNDTYLHAINLERHEFKNLKLSLFIEYLNSDELALKINGENYSFKNNYTKGGILESFHEVTIKSKRDDFDRLILRTNQNDYMIKVWKNLERLEFYLYYKDEKFIPTAKS